jgi:hypothetical protein
MKVGRPLVVLALLVALTACLEPPVSESLDIRMLPGGASVVTIGIAVRKPSDFEGSPKVRQRLEAETRALEDGTDPWSSRLRSASPSRERDVADREGGRLFRVTRHASFDAPADLRAFLRDTGVGVAYEAGAGWEELTILPGRSGRPTTAQRERVKEALQTWSGTLASYFAATADLYAYLDAHPDRARACLAVLLTTLPEGETLSDDEARLTKAVDDAMSGCWEVLVVPPDEAYTIDELSQMVYDPFPAPIRVSVPGKIDEREGFPGDLDAPLVVPTTSLWSSFERLEGRWAAPDIAQSVWRHDRAAPKTEFDLDAFVALPRRASRPDAGEVRSAIEAALRPASVYRVRWTPAQTPEAPLPFDREP